MRNIVYKSTFVKAIIYIVAAILILSVWPLKFVKEDVVSENPALTDGMTNKVNYINTASQVFMANYDHIQSVDVLIGENTKASDFKVVMYDTDMKVLAIQKVEVPNELPGYANVLLDVDVTKEQLYTLRFESVDSLYIGQEPWYNPETIAVSYYNAQLCEGMNLVMDYDYRIPLRLPNALLFIGIVILVAAILIVLTDKFVTGKNKDELITLESGLKWVLNPIVAAMLIAFVIAVFLGYVSIYTPDKIFAIIGAICLGVVLFYAINHDRSKTGFVIELEYVRDHISEIIQIIAIAGAIQACCEYVSALYDIHHYVSERKELLWFALIIIAMFTFKDIFNLYNLLIVILSGIAGGFYYKKTLLAANPPLDESNMFVLKANICIAILLVIILVRTVKAIILKVKSGEIKNIKIKIPFVILMAIYMVLIIVFRNTRYWTIELVVSFTLLMINYLLWEKNASFVKNVIYGVVLQFSLCTIWVWMHRPFSTYRCARYTHFFHTETVTATYLTMVACVSIVLLLSKIKSKGIKLVFIWKELTFFGVVMSYLLFTMARTAIFASGTAIIFALIVMIGFKGKDNCLVLLKTIGFLAISVVLLIPAVFEIQRTVPCLVSDPYEYDIDDYEDEILRGRQLNKTEYMTVGKLGEIFLSKLLGLETNLSDYHNTDDEYDEYHATYRQIYERIGYTWPGVDITDDMWDTEPQGTNHSAYLLGWDEAKIALNNKLIEEGKIGEWDTYDSYTEVNGINALDDAINEISNELNAKDENALSADEIKDELVNSEIIDYEAEPEIVEEEELDYTNGRIDIYKSYLAQLNMTGHDTMGALLETGEIATHAHDVYIQVAYDHGIPTAIVFIIFGMFIFILSIILYIKNKNTRPYMAVSLIIFIGFAVAGVVEWTYHYSHPMAFVVWLLITPLINSREFENGK